MISLFKIHTLGDIMDALTSLNQIMYTSFQYFKAIRSSYTIHDSKTTTRTNEIKHS